MRRTAVTTSGHHALPICMFVVAVMVLASVADQVHAKRGCTAFGHSCFGGHGKRFDPQFQKSLQQFDNKPLVNGKVEDYIDPDLILVDRDRGVQGRQERSFTGAPHRDSQRLDPYTLSLLVGQWLASHRRPHRAELEVNSK